MTEEQERLAIAGAHVVIVGAASTDLWAPIRDSFAAWLRRHASTETDRHLGRLESLDRRLRGPNPPTFVELRRHWRLFLLDVLMNAATPAAAATELTSLINEFDPTLAAHPPEQPSPSRDHLDFRGSTFKGTVAAVQHNHYGPTSTPTPALPAWRPVGHVGPVEFGVRPTRHVPGLPDVPPYVRRDCDDDLRTRLAHNGLVLILGEPYAGKSYMAWQGVRSLEGHTLCAPDPGDDLRAVLSALDGKPGDYVIWLDEVTDHLGSGGLDLRLLGRFTSLGAVMVGTISPEEYYRRRSGTAPGERVIAAARTVELAREWSDAELERLAGLDDPRAYSAYMWSGREGAASYFAIGHLLFDEWRRVGTQVQHPRGQLLVRAAVDVARCGVRGAVPFELLRTLQDQYGTEKRESFEDAFAWATTPLFGVSGLLVQGDEAGTWRAYGALVAEALRSGSDLEPVPDGVWWTLLDQSGPGPSVDRDAVLDAARTALHPRLKGDDTVLMIAFASRVGLDERRDLLRRAAEVDGIQGDEELATFFLTFGGIKLAMPYLEQAAEAGSSWAAATLGAVLRDQAEAWLRKAAAAGNAVAAHELGDMLVGTGREDEALRWYRKAAAAGRREVAVSLGVLLSRWRDSEADVWLRHAAAWGEARGAGELGLYLSWQPEPDAEKIILLLQQAACAGDATAAHNLGACMVEEDRFDEAMELYRQALDGGVTDAERSIAELLELQGKSAEAQDWYRRAATANPIGLPAALPPPPEDAPTPHPGYRQGVTNQPSHSTPPNPATPTPDLFTWEFATNPYPTYAWLREHAPVHKTRLPSGVEAWLVTRYVDAKQALADPRLSKNPAHHDEPAHAKGKTGIPGERKAELMTHLLNIDPPDHTRLRRLVSKAFTPRRVAEFAPRVQELTNDLIDRFAADGSADLIHDFAFPLPIYAICDLLGVPREDQDDFRDWAGMMIRHGGGPRGGVARSVKKMRSYLADLIHRKREALSDAPTPHPGGNLSGTPTPVPGEDLLSGLIRASDHGEHLTENEVAAMAFILLFAGFETTVNLIGNGTYALLTHPEQRARLEKSLAAGEHGLLETGVEELLRYDGPVELATWRFATRPLTLGGQDIAAGDPVLVVLAAADRDPERFADPDVLDLGRRDNQHLGYGHGIHYCLGAPLARLEGQTALATLLTRLPDLQLAGDPADLRWRGGLIMRGLRTLPVEFTPERR